MKYFIGNWKMFGIPKSINILKRINTFYLKDKNKRKYKIIVTPPYTLMNLILNISKINQFLWGHKTVIKKINFHQTLQQ